MRAVILCLLASVGLFGQDPLIRAEELYQKTDYKASLEVLGGLKSDGAVELLIGKNYFMLGEYKKATDALQMAFSLKPRSSVCAHWLGRAFGRRAETSNWFLAPGYASKARQYFEQAVALDPSNGEAENDLFDYYLEAPGILGGGYDKAEAVAAHIAKRNPAEGAFAQAQLADRRKQYDTAEEQLRRAMQLAPRSVGRILDLAKYLAKRGRYQESEATFEEAERLAPNEPRILFAWANTYVQEKRNLGKARDLLIKYLQSDLSPDDPPRQAAEKLLKQASSGS
jgi:tetratricopeptide (TPR) repeat protein